MKKILFVCHGSICRSPMAQFLFRELTGRAGVESQFFIDSAAVSREELGNPIYPPARAVLARHGIPCTGHRARQMTKEDYARFDLLLCMDGSNLRAMERICGGDPAGKLRLLLSFAGREEAVADPWYTGDFEQAYSDILEGCRGLLAHFCPEKADLSR